MKGVYAPRKVAGAKFYDKARLTIHVVPYQREAIYSLTEEAMLTID